MRCRLTLPSAPHAVIFDMDGLLLNTESMAAISLRAVAREREVSIPDDLPLDMIGVPAERARTMLAESIGESVLVDEILRERDEHLRRIIGTAEDLLKPGALELLTYLEHKDISCAVATSSSYQKTWHQLTSAGIFAAFDHVVCRDDVQRGKPHPDVYLEAAKRVGAPPRQCVALEDSPNGARAAIAAGAITIMVPDLLPPTASGESGCTVLPTLFDVLDMMRNS